VSLSTLDKMINTLKRGKTGGPARGQTSAGNTGRGLAEISDRKHLTSREVERLMEATKDSRESAKKSGVRCWRPWGVPRVVQLAG
jgi:hypothetical protein